MFQILSWGIDQNVLSCPWIPFLCALPPLPLFSSVCLYKASQSFKDHLRVYLLYKDHCSHQTTLIYFSLSSSYQSLAWIKHHFVSLFFLFFFDHIMWHAGTYFPQPGIELMLPAFEHSILTTGLPGKSAIFLVTHSPIISMTRAFIHSSNIAWIPTLCRRGPSYRESNSKQIRYRYI